MIRRPPRSTLTHAFPTRRSSDLWLAARRPYLRPRTQEDSRHDEVGSRRLHGVRRLVFLGFVSLVGHGGRSRSGPGRAQGLRKRAADLLQRGDTGGRPPGILRRGLRGQAVVAVRSEALRVGEEGGRSGGLGWTMGNNKK